MTREPPTRASPLAEQGVLAGEVRWDVREAHARILANAPAAAVHPTHGWTKRIVTEVAAEMRKRRAT